MRPTTPTPSIRTRGLRTRAVRPSALSRCVAPVAADEFLQEHFERRPLALDRHGEARYDDLLSEADVERLVGSPGLRHPAFRLVKAGEKISLSDYTSDIPWRPAAFTDAADPGRVATLFGGGATIVVQGLHHWWQPIALFCRDLERELAHPAQANAYYTPRDSQGLPVHHDTHDVFVLQIAGEKRWLVYEPALELPLRDQRYAPELGEPGAPVHDVVLRPGDALYLPRGWLHEAVTSATDSLHLTVGVNVYTWADALRAALAEAEADVELRRSVPATGAGGEAAMRALAERLEPEPVARRMRRKFVRTRRSLADDALRQIRALERLDLATALERRPTVIAEVLRTDRRIGLLFEGKRVEFPGSVTTEVEHVARAEGSFTLEELPGELDDEGRLVLARRLVREGFLRLADGEPRSESDGVAKA